MHWHVWCAHESKTILIACDTYTCVNVEKVVSSIWLIRPIIIILQCPINIWRTPVFSRSYFYYYQNYIILMWYGPGMGETMLKKKSLGPNISTQIECFWRIRLQTVRVWHYQWISITIKLSVIMEPFCK